MHFLLLCLLIFIASTFQADAIISNVIHPQACVSSSACPVKVITSSTDATIDIEVFNSNSQLVDTHIVDISDNYMTNFVLSDGIYTFKASVTLESYTSRHTVEVSADAVPNVYDTNQASVSDIVIDGDFSARITKKAVEVMYNLNGQWVLYATLNEEPDAWDYLGANVDLVPSSIAFSNGWLAVGSSTHTENRYVLLAGAVFIWHVSETGIEYSKRLHISADDDQLNAQLGQDVFFEGVNLYVRAYPSSVSTKHPLYVSMFTEGGWTDIQPCAIFPATSDSHYLSSGSEYAVSNGIFVVIDGSGMTTVHNSTSGMVVELPELENMDRSSDPVFASLPLNWDPLLTASDVSINMGSDQQSGRIALSFPLKYVDEELARGCVVSYTYNGEEWAFEQVIFNEQPNGELLMGAYTRLEGSDILVTSYGSISDWTDVLIMGMEEYVGTVYSNASATPYTTSVFFYSPEVTSWVPYSHQVGTLAIVPAAIPTIPTMTTTMSQPTDVQTCREFNVTFQLMDNSQVYTDYVLTQAITAAWDGEVDYSAIMKYNDGTYTLTIDAPSGAMDHTLELYLGDAMIDSQIITTVASSINPKSAVLLAPSVVMTMAPIRVKALWMDYCGDAVVNGAINITFTDGDKIDIVEEVTEEDYYYKVFNGKFPPGEYTVSSSLNGIDISTTVTVDREPDTLSMVMSMLTSSMITLAGSNIPFPGDSLLWDIITTQSNTSNAALEVFIEKLAEEIDLNLDAIMNEPTEIAMRFGHAESSDLSDGVAFVSLLEADTVDPTFNMEYTPRELSFQYDEKTNSWDIVLIDYTARSAQTPTPVTVEWESIFSETFDFIDPYMSILSNLKVESTLEMVLPMIDDLVSYPVEDTLEAIKTFIADHTGSEYTLQDGLDEFIAMLDSMNELPIAQSLDKMEQFVSDHTGDYTLLAALNDLIDLTEQMTKLPINDALDAIEDFVMDHTGSFTVLDGIGEVIAVTAQLTQLPIQSTLKQIQTFVRAHTDDYEVIEAIDDIVELAEQLVGLPISDTITRVEQFIDDNIDFTFTNAIDAVVGLIGAQLAPLESHPIVVMVKDIISTIEGIPLGDSLADSIDFIVTYIEKTYGINLYASLKYEYHTDDLTEILGLVYEDVTELIDSLNDTYYDPQIPTDWGHGNDSVAEFLDHIKEDVLEQNGDNTFIDLLITEAYRISNDTDGHLMNWHDLVTDYYTSDTYRQGMIFVFEEIQQFCMFLLDTESEVTLPSILESWKTELVDMVGSMPIIDFLIYVVDGQVPIPIASSLDKIQQMIYYFSDDAGFTVLQGIESLINLGEQMTHLPISEGLKAIKHFLVDHTGSFTVQSALEELIILTEELTAYPVTKSLKMIQKLIKSHSGDYTVLDAIDELIAIADQMTSEVSISTLLSNIGQMIATYTGDCTVIDNVDSLLGLSGLLEDPDSTIAKLTTAIRDRLASNIGAVNMTVGLEHLVMYIDWLGNTTSLSDKIDYVQDIVDTINGDITLEDGLMDIVEFIDSFGDDTYLMDKVDTIKNIIDAIGGDTYTVEEGLLDLVELIDNHNDNTALDDIIDDVKFVITSIKDGITLEQAILDAIDYVDQALDQTTLNDALNSIKDFIETVETNNVPVSQQLEIITAFVNGLAANSPQLVTALDHLIDGIEYLLNEDNTIVSITTDLFDDAVEIFRADFLPIFFDLLDDAHSALQALLDGVTIEDSLTAIEDYITEMVDDLSASGSYMTDLISNLTDIVADINDLIDDYHSIDPTYTIVDGLEDLVDYVDSLNENTVLADAITAIENYIDDVRNNLELEETLGDLIDYVDMIEGTDLAGMIDHIELLVQTLKDGYTVETMLTQLYELIDETNGNTDIADLIDHIDRIADVLKGGYTLEEGLRELLEIIDDLEYDTHFVDTLEELETISDIFKNGTTVSDVLQDLADAIDRSNDNTAIADAIEYYDTLVDIIATGCNFEDCYEDFVDAVHKINDNTAFGDAMDKFSEYLHLFEDDDYSVEEAIYDLVTMYADIFGEDHGSFIIDGITAVSDALADISQEFTLSEGFNAILDIVDRIDLGGLTSFWGNISSIFDGTDVGASSNDLSELYDFVETLPGGMTVDEISDTVVGYIDTLLVGSPLSVQLQLIRNNVLEFATQYSPEGVITSVLDSITETLSSAATAVDLELNTPPAVTAVAIGGEYWRTSLLMTYTDMNIIAYLPTIPSLPVLHTTPFTLALECALDANITFNLLTPDEANFVAYDLSSNLVAKWNNVTDTDAVFTYDDGTYTLSITTPLNVTSHTLEVYLYGVVIHTHTHNTALAGNSRVVISYDHPVVNDTSTLTVTPIYISGTPITGHNVTVTITNENDQSVLIQDMKLPEIEGTAGLHTINVTIAVAGDYVMTAMLDDEHSFMNNVSFVVHPIPTAFPGTEFLWNATKGTVFLPFVNITLMEGHTSPLPCTTLLKVSSSASLGDAQCTVTSEGVDIHLATSTNFLITESDPINFLSTAPIFPFRVIDGQTRYGFRIAPKVNTFRANYTGLVMPTIDFTSSQNIQLPLLPCAFAHYSLEHTGPAACVPTVEWAPENDQNVYSGDDITFDLTEHINSTLTVHITVDACFSTITDVVIANISAPSLPSYSLPSSTFVRVDEIAVINPSVSPDCYWMDHLDEFEVSWTIPTALQHVAVIDSDYVLTMDMNNSVTQGTYDIDFAITCTTNNPFCVNQTDTMSIVVDGDVSLSILVGWANPDHVGFVGFENDIYMRLITSHEEALRIEEATWTLTGPITTRSSTGDLTSFTKLPAGDYVVSVAVEKISTGATLTTTIDFVVLEAPTLYGVSLSGNTFTQVEPIGITVDGATDALDNHLNLKLWGLDSNGDLSLSPFSVNSTAYATFYLLQTGVYELFVGACDSYLACVEQSLGTITITAVPPPAVGTDVSEVSEEEQLALVASLASGEDDGLWAGLSDADRIGFANNLTMAMIDDAEEPQLDEIILVVEMGLALELDEEVYEELADELETSLMSSESTINLDQAEAISNMTEIVTDHEQATSINRALARQLVTSLNDELYPTSTSTDAIVLDNSHFYITAGTSARLTSPFAAFYMPLCSLSGGLIGCDGASKGLASEKTVQTVPSASGLFGLASDPEDLHRVSTRASVYLGLTGMDLDEPYTLTLNLLDEEDLDVDEVSCLLLDIENDEWITGCPGELNSDKTAVVCECLLTGTFAAFSTTSNNRLLDIILIILALGVSVATTIYLIVLFKNDSEKMDETKRTDVETGDTEKPADAQPAKDAVIDEAEIEVQATS
eukprot:gnl/Dysnectes_brevis/855_a947_3345.p1 GENE.gnl/Dysnectes_brevis/855_a947_3345~~gnl/Dysnectes_brevis/855_a947_3345.p1  ORF type:complete len:3273 (-),score=1524.75 gnl/Dysnectes_brevis/855_a947_3345:77-9895(-)